MKETVFWDLGFVLFDKNEFEKLVKTDKNELKKNIKQKAESVNYDKEELSFISNVDDENEFNSLRKFFIEDISKLTNNDLKKIMFYLCSVYPLKKYFFLQPMFYFTTNNFNILANKSTFLFNINSTDILQDYITKKINILFDYECFIVNKKFKKELKESFILEGDDFVYSKFDLSNQKTLKDFVEKVNNDNYDLILLKAL